MTLLKTYPINNTTAGKILKLNDNRIYSITEGLRFDGVNDRVIVPSSVLLNVTALGLSVIMRSNAGGGFRAIVNKLNAWALFMIDNYVRGYDYATGNQTAATATHFIGGGGVNHIVYNHTGAGGLGQSVYVNGILPAFSSGFSGAFPTQANQVNLGCNSFGGQYWGGDIWDVKIFDRPLTQIEINTLRDTHNQVIPSSATANLRLSYRCENKQGFVLTDFSGNGLNGSLTNYTVGDVTLGATNKWIDKDGNPILTL